MLHVLKSSVLMPSLLPLQLSFSVFHCVSLPTSESSSDDSNCPVAAEGAVSTRSGGALTESRRRPPGTAKCSCAARLAADLLKGNTC